jgi:hypothetical protein
MSEGSNEAYLDGHVEWVNARKFSARPKLAVFATEFFSFTEAGNRPLVILRIVGVAARPSSPYSGARQLMLE